jgi:RNA polymerase sigma-70 factor (ECF subfamily)
MNMRIEPSPGAGLLKEVDWNECLLKIGERKDRSAFSQLFSHFSPYLKSFLMKAGSVNSEIAEELVQETMIKVWRKAPSYSQDQASASTWIYTIARNTRIDWLRKQNRQRPESLNAEDIYDLEGQASLESNLVQLRNEKIIAKELAKIPSEQREALSLMYFKNRSGQEVAEELGLPLGTVKSRIRLALKKMKVGLRSTHEKED